MNIFKKNLPKSCEYLKVFRKPGPRSFTLPSFNMSVSTTLCSKKTCDHIFDDKLKQNYPFTKIFGTLITRCIGHRMVYLISHFTYFVQLLYLGKLSRPKYREFSLKFLTFSMLQHQDINCKIVTILYCLLIIQLTVYNRTITRFIADDNVVYQ